MVFHGLHPGDVEHDGGVGVRRPVGFETIQLDSVADEHELFGRRDVLPERLVDVGSTLEEVLFGEGRQDALDRDEKPPLQRGHVVVVMVAVRLVDEVRRAGEHSRDPADDADEAAVQVHDVVFLAPEEPRRLHDARDDRDRRETPRDVEHVNRVPSGAQPLDVLAASAADGVGEVRIAIDLRDPLVEQFPCREIRVDEIQDFVPQPTAFDTASWADRTAACSARRRARSRWLASAGPRFASPLPSARARTR